MALSKLNPIRQFVSNNLVATIGVTTVGTLLLVGASTGNIWYIYQRFQQVAIKEQQQNQRINDIRYLDEVLTMSARMAASTGKAEWETRYNTYVPKLEQTIKDTLATAGKEVAAEAAKTDAANNKLIALETQAFELVKQGKSAAALSLLTGAEYIQQKSIYQTGNDRVLTKIQTELITERDASSRQILLSIGIAVAILPVLLGIWLLVVAAVRDYIRERQLDREAIIASEQELQSANENLLAEIDKQAAQERAIRAESELLQQDIGDLLEIVSAIESGDFTVQAEVNERLTGLISDTLNQSIESLSQTLSQVSTAAKRVSIGSNKQRKLAILVAQRTEAQARSAAEVLQTTTSVRQSADDAATQLNTAKSSLDNLQTVVDRGQSGMDDLGREIDVLEQGSNRIVQQVKTLGEFVGLTDRFVREQAEIATETQILALNAALVAARAAEQQDPNLFAAVAQEFATIADRVSQLAQTTNLGLNDLEEQSSMVNRAVAIVDGDVQRLDGIVTSLTQGVKQTRELFQTVSAVTTETAAALTTSVRTSQEIVAATDATTKEVAEITNLSQSIATESQVARSLTDRLNTISSELLDRVQAFKLPSDDTSSHHGELDLDTSDEDRLVTTN